MLVVRGVGSARHLRTTPPQYQYLPHGKHALFDNYITDQNADVSVGQPDDMPCSIPTYEGPDADIMVAGTYSVLFLATTQQTLYQSCLHGQQPPLGACIDGLNISVCETERRLRRTSTHTNPISLLLEQ